MQKRIIWTGIALVAVGLGVGIAGYQVARPKTLHSGWQVAPAGIGTVLGDLAAGGELSPDKKWLAFVSCGQGAHRLVLVDAASGQVRTQEVIGNAWIGMDWISPDRLLLSGGNTNLLQVLGVSPDGAITRERTIPLPQLKANEGWVAGLAERGGIAYVAASGADLLLKVDLADGKLLGSLSFGEGSAPYQVRETQDRNLVVSLQGAAEVAVVNPADLTLTRRIPTGRHPNDLLVDGERVFVSCGNDDVVDVLDLYSGTREERLNLRPWPNAPAGSTPHALAISPTRDRLYVALSDNNCVGVVDVSRRGRSEIAGFIPTGSYPTAVAVLPSGSHLLAVAGKGLGTGPNGNTDKIDPVAPMGYPYIVTLLNGLMSRVAMPTPDDLAKMTRSVRELAAYREGIVERPIQAPRPGSNPVPSRLGDPSPIKHVLYIIKENRTYDQLFGDLTKDGKPYGNGEPKLTLFGDDVATNHRALAREYVLLDNLYCAGEVSVDGHHWTNGAYVPDFMQRTWPQQYSGKGRPRLHPNLAETPNGRIWDQVRRKGLSYRTYYYHTRDRMNAEWAKARADGVRDAHAIDIFIREFKEMERAGTVPSFMVMALSEDHTKGTRPGVPTPKACVVSNDIALGKLVEAISNSSLWSKFAIFVIEDDAQNGPDHVDAHRTVGLVISPYTRGAGLDSTHYTTNSMLRTMELILGLNPMTQHDAAATPMYRSFRLSADLTPYKARTPRHPMDEMNPPRPEPPLLASIDFSEPDQLSFAQEIALNKAIWASVKGREPYPGSVRAFRSTW